MPTPRSLAIALAATLVWSSLIAGTTRADVVDPGDVLIADVQAGVVRIEPTSNRRTVLAGEIRPSRLAMTPDGDLLGVSVGGELVHRIDLATGTVTTTPVPEIIVHNLHDVVVGPDGVIYAVDDESLFRFDPATGQVSVLFDRVDCLTSCANTEVTGLELSRSGEFFVTLRGFFNPEAGFLLSLDVATHTARFLARVGLNSPYGVVEDADGTLLVTAREKVVRIDPATGDLAIVSEGGKLLSPYKIAVSGDGKIYLTELSSAGFIVGGSQVVEIDPATGVQRILARPVSAGGIEVVPGIPAPPDCRDGIDNDGDRRVDFARDEGCSDPDDGTEQTPCADGIDNDGDGLVDFGADRGCAGTGPAAQENPQCSDRYDNDGDGLYDFPEDPECLAPHDNTEHHTPRNGPDR
jgi:streptogramin lyase